MKKIEPKKIEPKKILNAKGKKIYLDLPLTKTCKKQYAHGSHSLGD